MGELHLEFFMLPRHKLWNNHTSALVQFITTIWKKDVTHLFDTKLDGTDYPYKR